MTLEPGATLGRYQILGALGQGGMASVYRAFQPSLSRVVALKVLREGFTQDPEFLQRFQSEATAIARLQHPHIVQVFDFDQVAGRYFMAMQYLEGGTLKAKLAELAREGQRLPPREVARLVGEVADALAYAHSLGIVHRDIKPSNVMLSREGTAVVTDFGIAKILAATQHTQTGVGIGTPEYMSPEQGQGLTVDQRSDVYSLGVMAYEMLTGRVPFTADTPLAVVLAHLRDPLPLPSKLSPGVGPAMERALLRALTKTPDQRFPSATEFAAALQRAIAEDARGTLATVVPRAAAGASAAVPSPAPLRRFALTPPMLVGVLALAAVGAGAAGVLVLSTGPREQAARPTAPATGAPTVAAPGAAQPPTPVGAVVGPPRGGLLFQLDASPAGASKVMVDGQGHQVRFLGSAIEVELQPGGVASLTPAAGPLGDFIAEYRVRVVSGRGAYALQLVYAKTSLFAMSDTVTETVRLAFVPSGFQPSSPDQLRNATRWQAPSGILRDAQYTFLVRSPRFAVNVGESEAASITNPEARGPGELRFFTVATSEAFTVQLSSLRLSQLAP